MISRKMRETLEMIVEQSKVLVETKTQASSAMALMEENDQREKPSGTRDDCDAKRWKDEGCRRSWNACQCEKRRR